MIRAISNFFKTYNIFWNLVNFVSTIIFSMSHVIVVVILIGIPVLAVIGIYKIVKKKKSDKVENDVRKKNAETKDISHNVIEDINISNNTEKADKLIYNNKDVIYKDEKNVIVKRKYNVGFDIFMTIITFGLWLLWVIFRPKYKNYKIN